MNSRQRVSRIFERRGSARAAWMGHVSDGALPLLARAWGVEPTREALARYVEDDCRWVMADSAYQSPDGIRLFDPEVGIPKRKGLSAAGCLAEAETIADVNAYPWPDPSHCDFAEVYRQIASHSDQMVFTGMWSPFFHQIADLFGMENYFIKMLENPAVVDAVTERVADFYVSASERFWNGVEDADAVMFFGNDLGAQRGLLLSPELFRRFLLPTIKRLIGVGKKRGRKVMLHSCGSISAIIPDLIDAGVDALHPLQAKAAGMSARELKQYRGDLVLMGGIDAQELFVYGSPRDIREEVLRVRECLGDHWIVSPSHEEILDNVPPENLVAMMTAERRRVDW